MECEYVEPTFEDEQSNETEAESPDVIAPIQGGDHATTSDTQEPFQGGKASHSTRR